MATERTGDILTKVVIDAVALTRAERIPDLGELVLWRIPGLVGSWTTQKLVEHAFEMVAAKL